MVAVPVVCTFVAGLVAAGCATTGEVPRVRYANREPVTRINDRVDVSKPPATRKSNMGLYFFDGQFFRLITRALEIPRSRRALGVNALDEVPDSTWFVNRIGVRDVTLDEIRSGPVIAGSPEAHKPWTILSSKIGGRTVGFVVEDARGEKFILKFDRKLPSGEPAAPEVETAAEAIASRLAWAVGYNVAETHVVYFRPDELTIGKDATVKDSDGSRVALDRAEVERRLGMVVSEPDGRIRAIASMMIPGKVLGGHPQEGVRADDPNDRIAHEFRRDLRGAYAVFSWLDATDVKEANTVDTWIADDADPDHHYVKHYFIDFGSSLGGTSLFKGNMRVGREYRYDFSAAATRLLTLGMYPDNDREPGPGLRGVGALGREYEPGRWKPEMPAYTPFRTADRFDKFWAAKIMIRLTREQIAAAVEAARLSDPRSAEWLVDTLVARQRLTARYWFRRVNPLDGFAIDDERNLCFDDLMLTHGLAKVADRTRYGIRTFDHGGHALGGDQSLPADRGGRICTAALPLAAGNDNYTIVRITTARDDFTGTTFVHLARDSTGRLRIIGLWRE